MRSDTMDVETAAQTDWPVLARDRVRYVGEAVAAVVADDRYAAEDGAALVEASYEPLRRGDRRRRAPSGPTRPRLHDDWPDNVLMRTRGGGGDVAAAFAGAPITISETFASEPVTGVPLEARACLAALDEGTGVLTLWSSHQTPHVLRSLVAEHLGHPEHLLRVICPDMGGGFGIKTHLYPEDLVVASLALRLAAAGEVGADAARGLPGQQLLPRPPDRRGRRRRRRRAAARPAGAHPHERGAPTRSCPASARCSRPRARRARSWGPIAFPPTRTRRAASSPTRCRAGRTAAWPW